MVGNNVSAREIVHVNALPAQAGAPLEQGPSLRLVQSAPSFVLRHAPSAEGLHERPASAQAILTAPEHGEVLRPLPPSPNAPGALDHLREPGGLRQVASVHAQRRRQILWDKMLTRTYPRAIQSLLARNNPAELAADIEHRRGLLGSYACMAGAAILRGDAQQAAVNGDKATQEKLRLQTGAALLTTSDWPADRKVDGLTQIESTLREHGSSLSAFNFLGDTFMHLAMRSAADGFELAALLDYFATAGVDPNQPNAANVPAAHMLRTKQDALTPLQALLIHGADAGARDSFDYTLPHALAAHPQNIELWSWCETAGADLRATTERGETVLHTLLANRDDDAGVQFLLERGVPAQACDWPGLTAFDYAAFRHAHEWWPNRDV